jgi:hypothetical protein
LTCQSGAELYVAAGDVPVTITSSVELCSFGSGAWLEGPAANTKMQDQVDKWLAMHISDPDARFIVEGKGLPSHAVEAFEGEKLLSLRQILSKFEVSGEVNVELLHHRIEKSGANMRVNMVKPLCFVLDAATDKKAGQTFPVLEKWQVPRCLEVAPSEHAMSRVARRGRTQRMPSTCSCRGAGSWTFLGSGQPRTWRSCGG